MGDLFQNSKIPKIFYVDGKTYIMTRKGSSFIYEKGENIKKYALLKNRLIINRNCRVIKQNNNLQDAEAKIISALTTNVSLISKEQYLSEKNKVYTTNKIEASIIIPCKNEGGNLEATVESILNSYNNTRFEMIVINDSLEDTCTNFINKDNDRYAEVTVLNTENLGCAAAKNAGAAASKGEFLLFVDAHVEVSDYWIDILVNTIKNRKADAVVPAISDFIKTKELGYGETYNKKLVLKWLKDKPKDIMDIPIACGCVFAIKKVLFNSLNGFQKLLSVWGREDEELSIKLWLYGYRVVVNPAIAVKHRFRQAFPYEVVNASIIYNTLVLAYIHFNNTRIEKVINLLKGKEGYDDAVQLVKENFNLIFEVRKEYSNARIHDDDYFFEKFEIDF